MPEPSVLDSRILPASSPIRNAKAAQAKVVHAPRSAWVPGVEGRREAGMRNIPEKFMKRAIFRTLVGLCGLNEKKIRRIRRKRNGIRSQMLRYRRRKARRE